MSFRTHFLGIHFFNPPRYMKLVEIIPGESTNGEITSFIASSANGLGKESSSAKTRRTSSPTE